MKNKFSKLMFSVVTALAFTVSTAFATTVNITVNTANWGAEVSWDLTDGSGTILASGSGYSNYATSVTTITAPNGCYNMNMYDSFGDGWNGGTYSIADSASGQIYASGGLTGGAFGTDVVCWGPLGCTDPNATNYDANAIVDDGSCTYASSTSVTLTMYDSWGDGWNGNTFVLTNSAGIAVMTSTLATGSLGTDVGTLPDDCYSITCGGGSFANEVSWTLTDDATGNTLASGGSPYTGSSPAFCLPAVFGCTDANASNFDPLATVDDGSCTYPCIASDTTDSFEASSLGAWANASTNTVNWTIGTGTTPSGSTGPSAAFDGLYYIFTESSGAGSNSTADITVDCVDLSAWTNPAFVFAYHMYGATMGTVNVDVSTDGGTTWTNEWTLSGNQGDVWNQAVVPLSAYSGQIAVRVQALTGTSFTSDMAVDLLQFMEAPTTGCTDPFADNYNAAASIDDGSCLYTGCLDPNATNYCATCNVSDSTLCIYPVCNALDFSDNFEAANLAGNGWTTLAGPQADVVLSTSNVISDTVSLVHTGGDLAGWVNPTTEADAYGLSCADHISSSQICIDMSSSSSIVNMTFDADLQSYYASPYTWLRVFANGTQLTDVNGAGVWNNTTVTGGANTYTFDLSAYAGQSQVYIKFETSCKYGPNYSTGAFGNYVVLDNINVFNVTPCTYYGIAEDYSFDASCNGGADGSASATVVNSNGSDVYSWTDAAGTVVSTATSASGLSAGTYTCTVSDTVNGCSASVAVTIGEPTPISASAVVVDATSPINTDGAVSLSVSGGSPCFNGAADTLNSWDGTTEYIYSSVATGTTTYFDVSASTSAVGITGITQNGVYIGTGNIEVWTRVGSAAGNTTSSNGWTLNTSIPNSVALDGDPVYVPLMSPIAVQPGDVVGIAIHTPTTHFFTLGSTAPFVNTHATDGNLSVSTGELCANGPAFGGAAYLGGTTSYDPSVLLHTSGGTYTYAWSNGATTQDVSSLGMGPIAVTITDCNGCTSTWSGFVAANVVNGCTDPNASNFDPLANTDDGSCTYPGCTDSLATNFDPTANLDDSSCTYSCAYYGFDDEINIEVFTDLFGAEVGWELINVATGDTMAGVPVGGYAASSTTYNYQVCANTGCYIINWFDSFGDGWADFNGTQGYILATDANGDTLGYAAPNAASSGSYGISIGGAVCISGCMDSTAINYDATATIDDGSCAYCTDNYLTLNMYDSFGDGWNGNTLTMTNSSGAMMVSQTLLNGSAGTASLCLADDCYTVDVGGGSWQAEVTWEVVDLSGTIVLSGGAPFTGTLCFPQIFGCTDPVANNYDSLANTDDGSCIYNYGCTDPTAQNYDSTATFDDGSCLYPCFDALTYSTSFEDGIAQIGLNPSDWTNNTDDNTNGSTIYGDWIWDNLGTGSINTGPNYSTNYLGTGYAYDGAYYMYVESSGNYGNDVSMTSHCVDISSLTNPFFSAWVNMYGSAMGSLDVLVSNDNGATWNLETTVSGDQGPEWFNLLVNLSAYAGQSVNVKITATTGTSYTSDMCVDLASFVDAVTGCTDTTADNYNPAASLDDGSCIYSGCTNPFATNYNALASIDDGSCTFSSATICDVPSFTEDWSSASWDSTSGYNFGTNGWIVTDTTQASATSTYPGSYTTISTTMNGTNAIEFTGGDGFAGWTAYTTEAAAFANTSHVQSATKCMDLSGSTGSVALTLDYQTLSYFSGLYSSMRVLVNGTVLSDVNGVSWHSDAALTTLTYDLSAYAGQSNVYVQIQAACKYNSNYSSGIYGDFVWVDNINITSVTYGCTDPSYANYNPAATADDGSCAGCVGNDLMLVMYDSWGDGWNGNIFTIGTESATLATGSLDTAYFCISDGCYSVSCNGGSFQSEVTWELYDNATGTLLASGGAPYGPTDVQIGTTVACPIYGCTDATAVNYDANANTDDGSCLYTCTDNSVYVTVVTDYYGSEMTWNVTDAAGAVVGSGGPYALGYSTISDSLCLTDGCYVLNVYDSFGDGWSTGQLGSVTLSDAAGTAYTVGTLPTGSTASFDFTVGTTFGCTDTAATNYDDCANTDDGSCIYPCTDNIVAVNMYDSWGDGWNGNTYDISTGGVSVATGGLLSGAYGSDTLCLPTGCYDITVGGGSYPSEVSFDFGSLVGSGVGTYTNISIGGATCAISGCTDSTATNYDPAATIDDGSCTYPCLDNDVTITLNTGSYGSEVSWDLTNSSGSVVASGSGYGSFATYTVNACLPDDCYTFNMYDSWGDGWNGGTYSISDASGTIGSGGLLSGAAGSDDWGIGASCAITGCTDSTATNYDPAATVDDGSCTYPCTDNVVVFTGYDSWGDGWNGGTYSIADANGTVVASGGMTSGSSFSDTLCLVDGCYDVTVGGGSYDSEITFDFGSLSGATAGTYTTVQIGAGCAILGCTDSTALNYDPLANTDDGSCVLPVYGCTDSTAYNYDPTANVDDGSCAPFLYGCTDPAAANYFAGANTDDGSCIYPGCTDATATNYDPNANLDDGSCQYAATCGNITGIYVDNIIHDRVVFNWDDMNSSTCQVDQVRFRYREVGTNSYSTKTMGVPVGSGCNTTNTSKLVLNLTPNTQYEYDFKIWYCNAATVNWHGGGTFTTAPECDNVINVTATPDNTTKTTFCWDTVSTYSFVRLQYRENVPGSSFSNIGGFGVFSPLTCKAKNGLTPGTQYRVMWRTWCSATGGPYRSPVWDGPVIWDQPTSIRLEGGTAINNLDVYPNPSRDVFNVSFTSEDVQNLEVRIINVIGEVVYTENLIEFVGEYTKQVDLATYTKGVYFLEITTDNGVINKKLILQ